MTIKTESRPLKVLAPVGYPWDFSGPRQSRHRIERKIFVPFNRIRSEYDGVTLFDPVSAHRCDLIHAFNRIPLGRKPFVIGFESDLPRVFGREGSGYEAMLYRILLSDRCRAIVAISQFACESFRATVAKSRLSPTEQARLLDKLECRYPSLHPGKDAHEEIALEPPYQITFVGGHFARKGGCSVARMAELALKRGLPFHFNVISSLTCGGSIWSDPERQEVFQPYLDLLNLPNVTHHARMPNAQVVELLRNSHAAALLTFSDTFGFSAVEAMIHGTPVLATDQRALPEFIEDGVSGALVGRPRTPGDDEWRPEWSQRGTVECEAMFVAETERMAQEGIARLEEMFADPDAYRAMRRAAHAQARALFDPEDAAAYWDGLYERAAAG